MNKTFDQGKDEVAKLCRYFANNRQSFHAQGVKEAHIRQSLIDPFFESLGWDMRNAAMAAPQYREVITEDSLDIEGQQKAPDYTFRVGTLAKFYVEAKKCGVNINVDMGPAYQLRRYGFSARLALSILTDFEELGVYDCASRPRPNDKASHGRVQYFGFAEYPDRWREIWDVFSREAVWSGTFDQYAASKRKRGTSEVDSEFLKDIEGWRDVLARNIAIRNNDLSADDLNAAVQKIIDRIIFLRMAEDRGLESYGQLHKLCEQPDIYERFMSGLCQKADQKYNSGLFHFEKEPGVSDAPDSLTPDLAVDDNALQRAKGTDCENVNLFGHWYQVFHYYINKDKPGCDDAGVGAQRAVPFYRDGGGTARRAPTKAIGVRSPGSRNHYRYSTQQCHFS